MKKAIIILTIALTMVVSHKTKAQDGKILAGAGVGYATEIDNLSINASAVYQITDEWEGAFGFSYFLPKEIYGGHNLNWMGFDLDAHYIFSSKDALDFYGLAGLHITRVSTPSYSSGGYTVPSYSDTDTGFNIGAGARYNLSGNLYGVGEIKYVAGTGGYLHANVGILYRF